MIRISENFRVVFFAGFLCWQGCFKFRTTDEKAMQAYPKQLSTLQFGNFKYGNGKQLHYAKAGDDQKPTLFFIHGSPGAWNAFDKYLADSLLLQQYRMISVDRPGFGFSQFGKATKLEEQSEAYVKLLQSLDNQQPVYLVGHSLGGPIAVYMGAAYPHLFGGLVLLSGSVDPDSEPAEKWRRYFVGSPLQWLMPGAFRPSNDELFWFKKTVKDMPGYFQKIICPVAIVHGTNDRFVPYSNALFAQQALKNSSEVYLATLPNADHFIPWSHFADIRLLLLQFNQLPLHGSHQ